MRNWPKSKNIFWKSLRIRSTKELLQLSVRLKKPKLKFLESLKVYAKDCSNLSVYEAKVYPDNLKIEVDAIGFSDIFFPEDYLKLQAGLNKLLSRYPVNNYLWFDRDKLNKFFDDLNNSHYSASSLNIGTLSFAKEHKRPLNLLESINIHLHYVAPSFIVVSVIVELSDKFNQRFSSIMRSVPPHQTEILDFSLFHGVTSLSMTLSENVRASELESLFLEVNRGIVILFRRFLKVGLSEFGPLPSIEIIQTNVPLREVSKSKKYSSKASKEYMACIQLFDSLGRPYNSYSTYHTDSSWELYEVWRGEPSQVKPHKYQLLFSLSDYRKLDHHNELHSQDLASSYLFLELHQMLILLALEHFYEILIDSITAFKTELFPSLSHQMKGFISLKKLQSAISKMTKINGFYFQHSRIWTGVDENLFMKYLFREISSVRREQPLGSDSVLLRDDIKFRIDRIKNSCEVQLALLKLSYEQILSCKTVTLNYALQQAAFWLSIVVTLLTIVTLIPEDIRTVLMLSVWLRLQELWQLIKNW